MKITELGLARVTLRISVVDTNNGYSRTLNLGASQTDSWGTIRLEFTGRLIIKDFSLRLASGLKTLHSVVDLDEDSDGVIDKSLFTARPRGPDLGQSYDGANDLEDLLLQVQVLYTVSTTLWMM